MFLRKARLIVLLAALAVAAAGCAKRAGDPPPVGLGPVSPAALVIVTSQPKTLPAIKTLVTGAACPREHLEVVAPNFSAGRVLYSSQAPGPPTMPGPVPPNKLPADPTQYQRDAYAHELRLYRARLDADRHALERVFARQFGAWAASAAATVAANTPATVTDVRFRAGLSDATAYFASLNQTGANLGPRKVIVIFATEATADGVPPIRPSSLHGATVIVANFKAGPIRRAILRANLIHAGAGRAVILAPAASGQLPTFVRQALDGCK